MFTEQFRFLSHLLIKKNWHVSFLKNCNLPNLSAQIIQYNFILTLHELKCVQMSECFVVA